MKKAQLVLGGLVTLWIWLDQGKLDVIVTLSCVGYTDGVVVDLQMERNRFGWASDWQKNSLIWTSCSELMGLYKTMSSAQRASFAFRERGDLRMESIKIMKSSEPKIEPWGTPDVTWLRGDETPSRTTLWYGGLIGSRWTMTRRNQWKNNLVVRYRIKAFLMSKKTAPTWWLEASSWCQSFVTDSRASCVENPLLKPNCRSDNKWFVER